MTMNAYVPGQLVQCDEAEWAPLIKVLGRGLASCFMWMCEIGLVDETRVHAYKHVTTRRYLHLDAGGRAFDFQASDRYREIALATAISRAFLGWEYSAPPERDIAALRAAVQRARVAA